MRAKTGISIGVIGAAILLSACAPQLVVYPAAVFTHRVATQDLEIYWNCTATESDFLQFDGIARNIGGQDVRFLEFDLASVNARDTHLLSATGSPRDIVLSINQTSPFHLQLPTRGDETRFDLFYRYTLSTRFGIRGILEERHLMVRDACAQTQHRASMEDKTASASPLSLLWASMGSLAEGRSTQFNGPARALWFQSLF